MNDATGVFATYPGTLGIAAAVKGTARIDIIDKFADAGYLVREMTLVRDGKPVAE